MPKFNIKAQTIPTVESAYADVIGTSDNQIVEIKNELIVEDNNQRFKIHDDTIEQLAERIAKDGQLSPCIVAPMSNGKYELIDGRHRRRAVIKAGLPTTKCIIKTNLSEKEKQTIRLTSNLIRNNDYLPSELALAYKELAELEDMKTISEETNLSKKKIYRYIRLTYLIEPLLNRVDSGVIPLIAAVELSYVKREVQAMVFQYMLNNPSFRITTENARIIKFNGHSFPSVIEVLKEKEKQEAEVVKDEEVDNLSTTEPDQISETPEETTSSDSVKALVDKALEPYRTTAPASSGKHTEEESAEDNVSEVDNLSTAEDSADTEQPPEAQESVQPLPRGSSSFNTMIVGKDDLLYQAITVNVVNKCEGTVKIKKTEEGGNEPVEGAVYGLFSDDRCLNLMYQFPKTDKTIYPTEKGMYIIDTLPVDEMKSAEMTGELEKELNDIAEGKADYARFIDKVKAITRRWYKAVCGSSSDVFTDKSMICPSCGKKLVKGKTNVFCSGYKEGCKFSIPYTLCQKKLTDNQIQMLISSQRTNVIKGFISKGGKPFDASLKIDGQGKIEFVFPTAKKGKKK